MKIIKIYKIIFNGKIFKFIIIKIYFTLKKYPIINKTDIFLKSNLGYKTDI